MVMRVRGLIASVIVVLVGVAFAPAGRAATAPSGEAELLQRTNADRAANGLGILSSADDLVAVARRHAQRMADAGRIFHNDNLPNEVSGWQSIGENVGRATTVADVHDAFMASPAHRANVLRGVFTQAGMGIVEQDGQLWVVAVFRQPMAARAAAAPAAPKPAAAPRPSAPPRPVTVAPAAPAPVPVATPAPVVRTAERAAADLPGAPSAAAVAEPAPATELAAIGAPAGTRSSLPALAFVALALLGAVAGMTTRTTFAALRR